MILSAARPQASAAPEADSLFLTALSSNDSSNPLTIHAKTYYNNPKVQGGDEWYITLDFDNPRPDPPNRRIIPGEGQSTGWRQIEVCCEWVSSTAWNHVSVAVTGTGRIYPGMEKAQLTMTTSTWCLGYRPATWNSPDWSGNVSGCAFELVRITP
jgi:hypothetical protein